MAKVVEETGERAQVASPSLIVRKVQAVKQFYRDVKLEMKRVTWPTREEVYQTTVVTILAVFFFGYFLWGANWVLARLVQHILAFLSS